MGNARLVRDGKFIKLFETEEGWEFVSRKDVPACNNITRERVTADAVVIVPFIVTDGEVRLVLIDEWRAPMHDWIVGLPAGLVDDGENIERTAMREVHEETGLKATAILHTTPPLYSSEGLTDEAVATVYVQCEGEITKKYQEANEKIEIYTVGREEAKEILSEPMGKVAYFVIEDFVRTGSEWLWD